jgi:hypothetical protein
MRPFIVEALKLKMTEPFEFRDKAMAASSAAGGRRELSICRRWERDDWSAISFYPYLPCIHGVRMFSPSPLPDGTAKAFADQLMWHANLQATVLEVKMIDGLGMTGMC